MNDHLRRLIELQNIDIQIMEIERNCDELPARIEELDQNAAYEKNRLASLKEELEKKLAERKKFEQIVEQEKQKTHKLEVRLLEVKTNREYQAVLAEIAQNKASARDLEDQILELMEQIDSLSQEVARREAENQELLNRTEDEKKELEERAANDDKDRARCNSRREEIAKEINPSILNRYERIRQHRHGVAVVPSIDSTCMGCRMKIPPQMYIELQKIENSDLIFCPFCQRILFWEKAEL